MRTLFSLTQSESYSSVTIEMRSTDQAFDAFLVNNSVLQIKTERYKKTSVNRLIFKYNLL